MPRGTSSKGVVARAAVVAALLVVALVAIEYFLGGVRTTNMRVGHNLQVPRQTIANVLVDAAWAGWVLLATTYLWGLVHGLVRQQAVRLGRRLVAPSAPPAGGTPIGVSAEPRRSMPESYDDVVDAEIVDPEPVGAGSTQAIGSGQSVFEVARDVLGDPGLWVELLRANPEVRSPEDWRPGRRLALPPATVMPEPFQLAAVPATASMRQVAAKIEDALAEAPALLASAPAAALAAPVVGDESVLWPDLGAVPPVLPLPWMISDPGASEWAALVARSAVAHDVAEWIVAMRVSPLGVEVALDRDAPPPPTMPALAWPNAAQWGVTRELATLEQLYETANHSVGDMGLMALGIDEIGVVFVVTSRCSAWRLFDADRAATLVGLAAGIEFSPWAHESDARTVGFVAHGARQVVPATYADPDSGRLLVASRMPAAGEMGQEATVVAVEESDAPKPCQIPGVSWRPTLCRVEVPALADQVGRHRERRRMARRH